MMCLLRAQRGIVRALTRLVQDEPCTTKIES